MKDDDDEFLRQRAVFRAAVKDNSARIWYITRMADANQVFPEEHLKTLMEFETKARDSTYAPSVSDNTDDAERFQAATMAAARFIGARKPESIQNFADFQAKRVSQSPLAGRFRWLMGILFCGLIAHASNQYLLKQAGVMVAASKAFVEAEKSLGAETADLRASLAALCETAISYRSAAAIVPDRVAGRQTSFAPKESAVCGLAESDALPLRPNPVDPVSVAANDDAAAAKAAEAAKAENERAMREYQSEIERLRAAVRAARSHDMDASEALERVSAWTDFLTGFLVPSLFAALGALASAVRTADQRIRDLTFTPVDNNGLEAKTILGIAAGASVGIVLAQSKTVAEDAGLTLIGLAFIVGYSGDLFFSVLDGVKLGFGVKPGDAGGTEKK